MKQASPLALKLFEGFDQASVTYCNWKSIRHLPAAVDAKTDLDLLVCENDADAAEQVLSDLGFVKCKPPWFRRYQWIEDFIAIDPENGSMVHAHVHYRLIIGESGVKSFHLPWEKQILEHRGRDETFGTWVVPAAVEMALLIVRFALKKRFPQPLKSGRKRGMSAKERADFEREFDWLRGQASEADIAGWLKTLPGEFSKESFVQSCVSGYESGLDSVEFDNFSKELNAQRRFGRMKAEFLLWSTALFSRINKRISQRSYWPVVSRRVLPEKGIVVAILGPDGSGKSTLTTDITKHCLRKLDTVRIYLGSADNSASLWRGPLEKLLRKLNVGVLKKLFRPYLGLVIALEKKRRIRFAMRAREKGFIVIADRYPQPFVKGFNDGPRLSKVPVLAGIEQRMYERYPQPDLVVRLVADTDVLSARRPEMDPDVIIKKQKGFEAIEFKDSEEVYIDCSMPYEEVKLAVLQQIWKKVLSG